MTPTPHPASERVPAFPSQLRVLRHAAALSQEQLAERAALSPRTVGNLERGAVAPQPASAERLAVALGLGGETRRRFLHAAGQARRPDGRTPDRPAPPPLALPVTRLTAPTGTPPDVAAVQSDAFHRLCALAAGARTGTPTVAVLTGPAGAGKTTLALAAAHEISTPASTAPVSSAVAFAAAALVVDLRGSRRLPLVPGAALGVLLRGLGVADQDVPRPVLERSDLLRSLTAHGSGVIVLDDAAGEGQVRPLVPTAGSWFVIVTARPRLAGLFGASWHALGALTEEPGAAPRGLDRLSRTLLRIITLHPDRDHDAPSVAALAQVPLHDTEDALDSLVDAGLLADADTPGRFRLPFRTIPTPPPRTLERCAGGCPAL